MKNKKLKKIEKQKAKIENLKKWKTRKEERKIKNKTKNEKWKTKIKNEKRKTKSEKRKKVKTAKAYAIYQ